MPSRRVVGAYSVSVNVREAAAKEREEEIARMLSGKITEISRTHARELLGRKG